MQKLNKLALSIHIVIITVYVCTRSEVHAAACTMIDCELGGGGGGGEGGGSEEGCMLHAEHNSSVQII